MPKNLSREDAGRDSARAVPMLSYQDIHSIDEVSPRMRLEAFELLEEAFPPAELPTREKLLEMLAHPGFSALICLEETRLIGLLIYYAFPTCTYVALFATCADVRGRGIGGTMLDRFLAEGEGLIVLEAEATGTPMALRRLDFYRRHGFVVNEWVHIPPADRPGYDPVPFHMLSFGHPITHDRFEAICAAAEDVF
jgi:GNAT superfamily N-acetyltransferase